MALKTEKILNFNYASKDPADAVITYDVDGFDIKLTEIKRRPAGDYIVLANVDITDIQQREYFTKRIGHGRIAITGLGDLRELYPKADVDIFLMKTNPGPIYPSDDSIKRLYTKSTGAGDYWGKCDYISTNDLLAGWKYCIVALKGINQFVSTSRIIRLGIKMDWLVDGANEAYLPLKSLLAFDKSTGEVFSDCDLKIDTITGDETGKQKLFSIPVSDLSSQWSRSDGTGKLRVSGFDRLQATYAMQGKSLTLRAKYNTKDGTEPLLGGVYPISSDSIIISLPELKDLGEPFTKNNTADITLELLGLNTMVVNIQGLFVEMWYEKKSLPAPERPKYIEFREAENNIAVVSVAYNWQGNDITLIETKSTTDKEVVLARVDLTDPKQKQYLDRTLGYGRLTVGGLLAFQNIGNGSTFLNVYLCPAPTPGEVPPNGGMYIRKSLTGSTEITRDGVFKLDLITSSEAVTYKYLYVTLNMITSNAYPPRNLILKFDYIDPGKVVPYIPLTSADFTNSNGISLSDTDIAISNVTVGVGITTIFRVSTTMIPQDWWTRSDIGGKVRVSNWQMFKSTFSHLNKTTLEFARYSGSTWTKILELDDGTWTLPDLKDIPNLTDLPGNFVGIIIRGATQGVSLSNLNMAYEMWYDFPDKPVPEPTNKIDLHAYANFGKSSFPSPQCVISVLENKLVDVIKIYHPGIDEPSYLDLAILKASDILPGYLDRTGGYPIMEVSGMSSIESVTGSSTSLRIVIASNGTVNSLTSTTDFIIKDGTYRLKPLTKSMFSTGTEEIQIYLDSAYNFPLTIVALTIKLWWVVTDLPDITPPFVNMSKMSVNGYPVIGDTDGDTGVIVTSYRINNNDTNVPLATLFKEDIDPKYIKAGPGWLVVSGLKGFVDTGLIDGIDLVTFHLTSGTSGAVMTKKSLLSGTITKDGVYKVSQIDEVPEHGEGDYSGITFLIPSLKKGESAIGSRLVLRLFKEYNSPYQPYINLKDVEYVIPPTPSLPLNNKMFIFAGGPAGQSFEMMNLAFSKILENYKGRSGKGRLIVKGLDNVIAIEKQGRVAVSSIIGDSMFFNPTRDDLYELSSIPSTGGANFRVMYSRAPGTWNSADPALLSDIIFLYLDFIPYDDGSEIKNLRIGDTIPDSIFLGNDTVNPWKNEICEAYMGDTLVWRKSRTFENCWLKWGIAELDAETDSDRYTVNNSGREGVLELPKITDLENWISAEDHRITWNCPIKNTEFWTDVVIPWYSRNDITNLKGFDRLFTDSNATAEELVINLNLPDSISYPYGYSNYFLGRFLSPEIKKAKIVWLSGATIEIGRIFYGSDGYLDIEFDYSMAIQQVEVGRDELGKYAFGLCPVRLSMCFAEHDCYKRSIPGFIWLGAVTSCHGLFSRNVYVHRWEDYNGGLPHSYEDGNIVKINSRNYNTGEIWDTTNGSSKRKWALTGNDSGNADSMFAGCTELQYVGPIIDMTCGKAGAEMFRACTKLTDLRLKGISNGDWDFTSSDLQLPSLDAASVAYIFANAVDLHKYDPHNNWKTCISQDHGKITIPPEWNDKVSDTMIIDVRKKGWDVWKDGAQYIPSSTKVANGQLKIKAEVVGGFFKYFGEIWLDAPAGSNIKVTIPIKNVSDNVTSNIIIDIPRGHARGSYYRPTEFTCTQLNNNPLPVLREATDPLTYNIIFPVDNLKVTMNYDITLVNNTQYTADGRFYVTLLGTDRSTESLPVCNILLGSLAANSSKKELRGFDRPVSKSNFYVTEVDVVVSGNQSSVYANIVLYIDGSLLVSRVIATSGSAMTIKLSSPIYISAGTSYNITGTLTYQY